MMKTHVVKLKDIERKWYIIDAKGIILGRLATHVAKILRGKHKPNYTAHLDMGDNVIIINAQDIVLTGKKLTNKIYYWHTGYPGGIKSVTASALFKKGKADFIVHKAIERMISRNPLGRAMLKKLYVYNDQEHKQQAQKPEKIDIASMNRKNTI